jgi:hypothetical protein
MKTVTCRRWMTSVLGAALLAGSTGIAYSQPGMEGPPPADAPQPADAPPRGMGGGPRPEWVALQATVPTSAT